MALVSSAPVPVLVFTIRLRPEYRLWELVRRVETAVRQRTVAP